jgi:hypothetical protein
VGFGASVVVGLGASVVVGLGASVAVGFEVAIGLVGAGVEATAAAAVVAAGVDEVGVGLVVGVEEGDVAEVVDDVVMSMNTSSSAVVMDAAEVSSLVLLPENRLILIRAMSPLASSDDGGRDGVDAPASNRFIRARISSEMGAAVTSGAVEIACCDSGFDLTADD